MASDYKDIGILIKRLRDEKGLSQSHIADIAGINRSYFGRIERGEVNFTIDILISIANALQVRPSRLLEGLNV